MDFEADVIARNKLDVGIIAIVAFVSCWSFGNWYWVDGHGGCQYVGCQNDDWK